MTPPESRIARNVACAEARRWIHEDLDASLDAESACLLARHVAGCADCRERQQEFSCCVSALRSLPELRFEGAALDSVWHETIEVAPTRRTIRSRAFIGSALAVAALLLLAFGLTFEMSRPRPAPVPASEAALSPEVARAAADMQLALNVTGHALARGGHAALDGIAGSDLAHALDHIPLLRLLGGKLMERND